jgi:hypothetical protein
MAGLSVEDTEDIKDDLEDWDEMYDVEGFDIVEEVWTTGGVEVAISRQSRAQSRE